MSGEYVGWTPPPGVGVVPPPCHPRTVVDVIYSDASNDLHWLARDLNWSAVGDGPGIVAYCVVSEYKPAPEPREWWMVHSGGLDGWKVFDYEDHAARYRHNYANNARPIIHVREVLPAAREVVAPRAMKAVWNDRRNCFEIYVTNVDYRDGTTMTVFGDLP